MHIGTELADSDLKIKELIGEYVSEIESLINAMLVRNGQPVSDAAFYARHLTGLFCTAMSFCLILPEDQKKYHITNGINIIFNKKLNHA